MYDLMRSRNDALAGELIRFTQTLVQKPSYSLNEEAVADCVHKKMRQAGYDRIWRDDAGNVAGAILGREADPTVLLTCHMDTASADPASRWQHPPFSGEVVDGQLFGRGAADCKGGLAAQLYAGVLLKRSLLPLRGNLVVAATVAEENGCSVGLRRLLEKTLPAMNLKPTYAILGEPTDLNLYYGHHGWFELDIHVAAEDSSDAQQATKAIYGELKAESSLARQANRPAILEVADFDFSKPNPDRQAVIHLTRRLVAEEDMEAVIDQIRRTVLLASRSVDSVHVEVAVSEQSQRLYNGATTMVRRVAHAWETDPFHALVSRSRDALLAGGCKTNAGKWKLSELGMGTGGGVLVREFQIPTIGYGPGCETQIHAVDEHVSLANLKEAVYGTALIVHSLVGVPVYGWTFDGEV